MKIELEIFKDIIGFEDRYQISNLGRVKILILKPNQKATGGFRKPVSVGGYLRVGLTCDKGKQKNMLIHRLVAIAFIPNPKNKPCVNHINGIKHDNRIENLEWCTHQENTEHSLDIGLRKYGEENKQCTLKNWQVIEVRRLLKEGMPRIDISKKLGIKIVIINNIANNVTHKRVG